LGVTFAGVNFAPKNVFVPSSLTRVLKLFRWFFVLSFRVAGVISLALPLQK